MESVVRYKLHPQRGSSIKIDDVAVFGASLNFLRGMVSDFSSRQRVIMAPVRDGLII